MPPRDARASVTGRRGLAARSGGPRAADGPALVESAPLRRSLVVLYFMALIGGVVGALPLAPLGLVLPEVLSWPISLGFGALTGALLAGWVANRLALDGTRTHLVWLALAAFVASLFGDVVVYVLRQVPALRSMPNFYVLLVCLAVAAAGISRATVRYRTPSSSTRRDVLLTIGLLALGMVAVVAVVSAGCSAFSCTP
jgi:hypothetical protein